MRQVAINWISATLVITSWCSVCCSVENASSRIRIHNALHSTNKVVSNNVEHKIKASSSPSSSNEVFKSNASDKLKDELLAIGTIINHSNGQEQLKTKTSNDDEKINTLPNPATSESLLTSNRSRFALTPDQPFIPVESSSADGSKLQEDFNGLPKVLDPSIKTLAAISRRSNKKSISKNHKSNHDRQKRSSYSLQNLDIGDDKYLKNIIGVEYRRPWRIAKSNILPIVKDPEYSNSERDYPKYKSQDNIEISSIIKNNQIKEKRNSIPNLSSLEDKYQNIHKSSYYPISSPFLSSDDSLPLNSISSSSLYSSSDLHTKNDPPSSYHFDSKKSAFFKSPQTSDLNKRQHRYQVHQEHKYKYMNSNKDVNNNLNNNIDIKNDIGKDNNDNDVNESEFKDIQPVAFQSSSKLASSEISPDSRSRNNNIDNVKTNFESYGTKDKKYDKNYNLQMKNGGSQKQPVVGSLAVEEPLALAASQRLTSSSSSSRSGQREQLPAAATSNIINAGQSMVRSIMKRRTKTGRYDVPQVGKLKYAYFHFIYSGLIMIDITMNFWFQFDLIKNCTNLYCNKNY